MRNDLQSSMNQLEQSVCTALMRKACVYWRLQAGRGRS